MLDGIASNLIRVESDNLVARPWGGHWLRSFKGLAASAAADDLRWGEAFEIAAFDADDEACRYPSRVCIEGQDCVPLPRLLERHAAGILGQQFVARYGPCFPLLPKTLDIKELLSVQGHPPGHTEVYIIIDAEPGASLRLGFNRDIDPTGLLRSLRQGLELQDNLVALLGGSSDGSDLQRSVAPWFAGRELGIDAIGDWLDGTFSADAAKASAMLVDLKRLYWTVLDSMNAIAVEPGQVIYNATPARLLAGADGVASAEVHALGNPEGKEILALEVRRPGPTFRAWDNVRFPKRAVDVDLALRSLNLRATRPEEFIVSRRPVAGCDGMYVSVDAPQFRVEHLLPEPGRSIAVTAAAPHSLHCIAGAVEALDSSGRSLGALSRGQSALVPVNVTDYRIESTGPAELIRVTVPTD